LVIERGSGEAQVYPLAPGRKLIIGRDSEADIVIDDPGISRRHASIWASGRHLFVEDLGSRNGIYVQGRRIATSLVASGDYVFLGGIPIRVILGAVAGRRGTL
jgi:pSer/pThr/pTyr-binding forkhead associated (FHA) protein